MELLCYVIEDNFCTMQKNVYIRLIDTTFLKRLRICPLDSGSSNALSTCSILFPKI